MFLAPLMTSRTSFIFIIYLIINTYSGSHVDLYRLLLPPHSGSGGASDGGGRFALRAHLRL